MGTLCQKGDTGVNFGVGAHSYSNIINIINMYSNLEWTFGAMVKLPPRLWTCGQDYFWDVQNSHTFGLSLSRYVDFWWDRGNI